MIRSSAVRKINDRNSPTVQRRPRARAADRAPAGAALALDSERKSEDARARFRSQLRQAHGLNRPKGSLCSARNSWSWPLLVRQRNDADLRLEPLQQKFPCPVQE